MPFRKLKLKPTRINHEYIYGARYHWDRITEAEARELGLTALPGPAAGNSISAHGVVVRRLKDGRLNVIIESTAPMLRDTDFSPFLELLLDPVPHGTYETLPCALDPEATRSWNTPPMEVSRTPIQEPEPAVWDYDAISDRFVWSKKVYALHGVEPRAFSGLTFQSAAHLLIAADDLERINETKRRALRGETEYDVTYRLRHSGRKLRAYGTVLRQPGRHPTRMVGVVVEPVDIDISRPFDSTVTRTDFTDTCV